MSQNTELTEFDQIKAQIETFVGPTMSLTITDQASSILAQGTLKTLKEFEKMIDLKRTAAVKPLNDRVKSINEYAKLIQGPIAKAEAFIKGKMVAYAEQEARARAEEQKRIEEKMREIERESAAKRRILEEEAKAKREAESKALREAQEAERNRIMAEAKKRAEAAAMFGQDKAKAAREAEAQRVEMAERMAAAKAASERRAEEERLASVARMEREQAEENARLDARRLQLEAERPKNTRQVPEWRIVDADLVPEAYWKIDEVTLGAAVRGGVRDIPGVEIVMKTVAVAR